MALTNDITYCIIQFDARNRKIILLVCSLYLKQTQTSSSFTSTGDVWQYMYC